MRSKSGASRLSLPRVNILPQVGPVSKEENILSPEYVRASMSSRLSSSHFRNQLNLVSESYEKFVQLTEETWPGLRIRSLVRERGLPNDPLSLIVQDGRFSGEIRWMGHGLQVWLQTIWFLSRVPETQPVILDEPDVYLHPDLQRKLIRLLRRRSGQTIVATHSVEILSEVDPEQILVVERLREKSKFATSLAAVQKVTESIGSVHNIHLARLSSAKKFLFIEGDDDLSYLQAFQNVLFQDSQEPFGAVPCKAIGGWNGWNEAIGSSVLIQNESGGRVSPYCILDSDYHTPDEILRRYTEAKGKGIKLHIWRRKEIENYLVSPAVIERVINVQIPKGVRRARTIDVTQRIHEVCRDLRDQVTDAIAEVIFNLDRKAGFASAMRKARASVNSRWDDEPGDGLSIVSGKKVISALSAWSQERYKVTISATRIARSMRRQEISDEIVQVVSAIENLTPMQTAVAEH